MTITPLTSGTLVDVWMERTNDLINIQNDIEAESDGFLRVVGGLQRTIKSNLTATVAPTATDDAGDGYEAMSNWFDTVAKKLYICVDATASAAVWQAVGSLDGLEVTKTGDTVYLNNETGNIVFQIAGEDAFEITPTGFAHLGMKDILLKPNNAVGGADGNTITISGGDGGSGDTDGGRVILKGGFASGSGKDAGVGIIGRLGAAKVVDGNYTATERDDVIFVDTSPSDITVTLPDPSDVFDMVNGVGLELCIKKIDGDNRVIVTSSGGIDGEESLVFSENLDAVVLRAGESEWRVVQRVGEIKEAVFDGLVDNTKFTITYNSSTRVFSVTTANDAIAHVSGNVYHITNGVEETTPHADTTGLYFLYYNEHGELSVLNTVPEFGKFAALAYIYYNANTNLALLFDERHPATMPAETHKHLHECLGTCLVSGCALSDYTLNTAGNAALSYSVSSGVMRDESLRHELNPLADGGPYRVQYRTGLEADGYWEWASSNNGILGNGTNLYYNQFSGGSWSLTPITDNNRWVNYWLCAAPILNQTTGAKDLQYFSIIGQTLHTSLATAQAADPSNAISWDHVQFREVVVIAKLIYRRVGGSSPENAQLTEVQRYFGSRITASGGISPTSHTALSDRTAIGSHPASAISVDNSGFTNNLSSAEGEDDTVQKCLQTIDALIASGGSSSTIQPKSRLVDADDAALITDCTIRCDATTDNITITLPTAASAWNAGASTGLILNIKKIDASVHYVDIAGNGAETIDGETSQRILTQYETLSFQSNGTSWDII